MTEEKKQETAAEVEIKIYTSYYAKKNQLEEEEILPIGISVGYPRGIKGLLMYKPLNPTWAMLNGTHENYLKSYDALLRKLNAQTVCNDLQQIAEEAGYDRIALCCYEKPGDFCHRRLVAEWLERELGIEVKEYRFNIRPNRKQSQSEKDLFDD